ncbi:MAG TPA: choice-of-anchor D domain-containing protein, partial [Caldithrix sp.]|nr:choice-of-anchor D domain-containing protein [Caldithrix sp.]
MEVFMKKWLQFFMAAVLIFSFASFGFAAENEEVANLLKAYTGGQELSEAQMQLIQPYLEPQKPLFGPPTRGALNEGFESGLIPANWTVYDNDGDGYTWGTSTSAPHTGTYHARVRYNASGNDDWLITPALAPVAGDSIKFWAKSASTIYFEDFVVKLSTTGTAISDFTVTLGSANQIPNVYNQYAYDLTPYAGGTVYVAVVCVSVDQLYLDVDDFEGPEIYTPPTPIFAVNPDSVGFGNTNVGDTSAVQTVTVKNEGGGTLTINSVALSGLNPGEFFVSDTNTYPVDLGYFESMSVDVYFVPTSLGDKMANLTFVDNTADATHDVPLTGTGISIVVSTYPYLEDFETFTVGTNATGFTNNWSNDPTNTTSFFRWNVDNGGTPSSNTGPTVDHTLGTSAGIYLFTEASSGSLGDSAFVYTPPFDLSPLTNPVMEFWYHMFGSDMGELHVDALVGGSWVNDIMTPLIGQQQGSQTDPWLKKTVDLSTYAGQTISLRFRSYRGSSFAGDMAIDDFHMGEAVFQPEFSASPVMMDLNDANSLVPVGNSVSYYVYSANTGLANLGVTGINTSTE